MRGSPTGYTPATRSSYKVRYKCSNCGWSGEITFNRGKKASKTEMCPNCDCFTAEKAWDVAPMFPMPRPAPRPNWPDEPYPYIPWPTPFPEKDPWEDPRPWRRNVPYCFMTREEEDRRERLRNYRVN